MPPFFGKRHGFFAVPALVALLVACSPAPLLVHQDDPEHEEPLEGTAILSAALIEKTAAKASATSTAPNVATPVLFVTQVPTRGDEFASRGSTFANHLSSIGSVPRGGDLMIRYPNGSVRNLTREAGFGMEGQQGANAIAVREPTVHWDGQRAIFSMLIGAPVRYQHATNPWQLYEVTGLGAGQTARIQKVAGQPERYNNVSPLYASDDQILFTSDRPRDGQAHLHPQLDEYESTPTVVGIYQLNPATGALQLLNHTPSGAFSPTIDSAGRIIFTRWDHLQRDQQTEVAAFGAYNFPNESPGAAPLGLLPEVFPEARLGSQSPYGYVNGFTYNLFSPWQMNQDGTDEVTLNHIGRQELSFGYIGKSFAADNHLQDNTGSAPIANTKFIRNDGGLFNLREDPLNPGHFYSVYTREFATLTTGQLVRIRGPVGLQAEQMTLTTVTPEDNAGAYAGGRYRSPLPMSNGAFVATYTPSATIPGSTAVVLRLQQLQKDASGNLSPGTFLTPGISKTVSWWDPDNQRSYTGLLWELDPVEVVARPRPSQSTLATTVPEKQVFEQEEVSETAFKAWLQERNLALIVVRNQTHRDRGDRQQPFNLRVPGGVSTVATNGLVYDVAHFQIFQANLVRSYQHHTPGRRPLPQPADLGTHNLPNAGPASSVPIASDGSSAAIVPAKRALTWQTTDGNGNAVVRERLWVTLQPGEIRTCTGCHGENTVHQGGGPASTAPPAALRTLLRQWKAQQGPVRVNGSQPLVPGRG